MNVIEKNASSCKKGEYIMKFNRDKYLSQLIKSKENGFPKIITGIRRCGKSYLLDTIYRGIYKRMVLIQIIFYI